MKTIILNMRLIYKIAAVVMVLLLVLWALTSCNEDRTGGFLPPPSEDTIDLKFLNELELTHFNYFWVLTNAQNGLVPDRSSLSNNTAMCSIAATGFGLTAYIVGVERGFVSRSEAAERVLTTLRFFADAPQSDDPTQASGYKGFFYHFLNRT
ncbi:MAG: hypothetical protein PHV49_02710, partial [Alistipes sp.]|nr:hypothetical protein [Alistipes sp.]